ncbi:xylulokinase [Paramicrobacterium agarici]|uniref:Xylulokinase n=1 Tax=Paramicrobacterium agarici TaxID=630514 RepID=A0A2A9DVE4_9MICO|nr:FGGY-family carbohydrate kinase [Microbacterium agarici]PFG29920.1 xylulokinase [Microbacterium agarici]
MTAPLVLSIDIGSSTVRSAIVDGAGTVVASARVARFDAVSGVEFVPETLWSDVVTTALSLPDEAREAVVAMGIAGHVGTVFVDEEGVSVGPGRGWADSAGVDLIREAAGDELSSLLRETGRPIVSGGAGAAFLALRHVDPAMAERVSQVLTPKDFIVARLTGRSSTDRTSAAYSGLSAVADGEWSAKMIALAGLTPAQLPDQRTATDVVGTVTSDIARELGLADGVVVVAGATDGSAGAAFVLRNRDDLIADIAGTTDVLLRITPDPVTVPAGAVVNPYPLGGFSVGGPTGATGGALTRWSSLLGLESVTDAAKLIESANERIGPGAGGLVIDPSLSGARFPYWRAGRAGAVYGQRDEHRVEHFLLAAAEGAAHVVRDGVDALDPGGTATLILAGGAARSLTLAQLRANVLGRTIEVCEEPDVTILGAALLAFDGAGVDVTQFGRKGRRSVIQPHPASADAYESLHLTWRTELGLAG